MNYREALQAAREALASLHELCLHGDFSNGVTDATGSIDEGSVRAGERIDEAQRVIALIDSILSAPSAPPANEVGIAALAYIEAKDAAAQEVAETNKLLQQSAPFGIMLTVPTQKQQAYQNAEAALRSALDSHRSARQAIPKGSDANAQAANKTVGPDDTSPAVKGGAIPSGLAEEFERLIKAYTEGDQFQRNTVRSNLAIFCRTNLDAILAALRQRTGYQNLTEI